jgi:hypothetical protein
LRIQNVKHYIAKNTDVKACIAERFVRSLKELIFKYLTSRNTYRYVDVLDDLLHLYNNRFHSTIKMAPSEVNDTNILDVWSNTREARKKKFRSSKQPKFEIGSYVRVSKANKIFFKSYLPNYSDEIFIVKHIIYHTPIVYKLTDLMDEDVDGTFYEEELQEVIKDEHTLYRVNKILDTRRRKGVHESLIEWKGWPSKFNLWIPNNNINLNSY